MHPIAIDSAQLVAAAVAIAMRPGKLNVAAFLDELRQHAGTEEFRDQLELILLRGPRHTVDSLGTGIEAHKSVGTAIAAFGCCPEDYAGTIALCVDMGGDTDTIAAMAGAISGAHNGFEAIPDSLVKRIERNGKGVEFMLGLADQLYATWQTRR